MPLRPSHPGWQLLGASLATGHLESREADEAGAACRAARARGLLQARRPDLIVDELYKGVSDGDCAVAETGVKP